MKIKPEHYETLAIACDTVLASFDLAALKRAYKDAGHTHKRFRWDVLYASKLKIGDGRGMDGLPLYEYMNDEHIDTALRAILGSHY